MTEKEMILNRLRAYMPFEVTSNDAYGYGRRDALNQAIELIEAVMTEKEVV